jgi:TolB-like protein/DNA-binding CsgD family transcriptional regulator/cytochrome c-type biogenesis protein CcmH/NrfG
MISLSNPCLAKCRAKFETGGRSKGQRLEGKLEWNLLSCNNPKVLVRNVSSVAAPEYDLTPRQVEILNLIGRGLSNRDIGEVLGISINTVKVHVAALMNALDVSNRTEAVFIYEQLNRQSASRTGAELQLAGSTGRPGIAVLPMVLNGDSEFDHLSRALTEELISRIGTWKWFPVLGYEATAGLNAVAVDYAKLRADLNVEYCVAGQIQQLGEALRIRLKLVHASSAEVLWSEQFSGGTGDLFGFIDAAARKLVGQMAPELLRRDGEHTQSRSFPAWNEASRAMWHIYIGSRADSEQAAFAWERAIELDPHLVYAWYAKAAGLYQRVFNQWSEDPKSDMRAFVSAAEHCVMLDISDSAAQEICGFARLVSGHLDDAIVHLERAVALNPSNAQAYSELGQAYTFNGELDKGIAALEEALAINPQGDSAWSTQSALGFAFFMMDDLDSAIEVTRKAAVINPNLLIPQAFLAGFLAVRGDMDEAANLRERVLDASPDFDARKITRGFEAVSPELCKRFEVALRQAGFDL